MQSLLVVNHHLTTCGGHTPVCQYLKKINQSINAKSRSLCPSANVFSFSSGWGVSLQQNADRMAFLPLPLIVFRALLTRYRALFFVMSPTRKEDHCVNWYPIWDKLSWSIVKKTSVFLLTYPRNCRFGKEHRVVAVNVSEQDGILFRNVSSYIKFLHCTLFPLHWPLDKHLLTAGPSIVYPGLQRYLT